MKIRAFGAALAAAILLACSSAALAQSSGGTSCLAGSKGGTGSCFMQFTGPASSVKTFTLPNQSDTIATLGAIQTFTAAKTFASGKLLLGGSSSGAGTLNAPAAASAYVWTLPTATDTIVGRATTDTLTNKTLTSPVIASIVNVGTLTLPTSTDTLVGRATTDTLTNKTFDTAGTGNSLSINGLAATANTGTGAVARATSPTLTSPTMTTPTLGVASATSVNKVAITAPATGATLTIPDGVTLTGPAASGTAMTLGNAETVSGAKSFNSGTVILKGSTSGSTTLNASAAASGTLTLPAATDTLVGKATTDTFTNKTFDTAGAGNSLSINGLAATANTGTGAVARATSPTFVTPTLGAATATSINGNVWTAGTGTLTIGASKTLTTSNTLAFTGTDGSSISFGAGGTVAYTANNLSAFAATTSSQLAGVVSDETGTGALVFANSPTLVAPALGTPASGVLTNATGLPTTGLVNNAVTNAKLAQMAQSTVKGRAAGAGTGDPTDLSTAQLTALVDVMVGDSGTGGTKGAVPAPGAGDGAAGKFLSAKGLWEVPAGGGGGGGGMTDEQRQNTLLDRIYQSKALGDVRRVINSWATGLKASTSALRGLTTETNADVSNAATGGYVQPLVTVGTNQIPLMTAATTSGVTMSADTEFSGSFPAYFAGNRNASDFWSSTTSAFPHWLKTDFGSAKTIATYTVQVRSDATNAPTAWTLQASSTGSFAGEQTTLDTQTGQTWTGGQIKTFTVSSPASYRYYRLHVTAGNDASGTLQLTEVTMVTANVTSDMILATTAQTTPSVSNARVLMEVDDTASPTLNTDLTVEVTCNGGTNWSSASASSVGRGQSGRLVAETVDQACTAGTSAQARVKTFGKLIPIHGLTLTVH